MCCLYPSHTSNSDQHDEALDPVHADAATINSDASISTKVEGADVIIQPAPLNTCQAVPISSANTHGMQTRSKLGIYKPKVCVASKEPGLVDEELQ